MKRIVPFLLIVAMVVASAQIYALTVELLSPPEDFDTTDLEMATALRWKVYWFGGLPLLALGLWLVRRYEAVGYGLSIAGVNAMLVGNNGGFSSIGFEVPRLTTSVITFLLLVGIAFVAANKRS